MSSDLGPRGAGGAVFAAVIMMIAGCLGVLAGLAGLIGDNGYGDLSDHWTGLDTTALAWWFLIVGAIILIAGFGVIGGAAWARWTGIIIASIQLISNFVFLTIPGIQWWALCVIAIDIWVIHSLFVYRAEELN